MPRLFATQTTHDSQAPALAFQSVSVFYGNTPALEDISFQLDRGAQVAVVGPNGAGKSTLFNIIAGITKPDQGDVHIYGSGPDGHICVGYVPQRNRIDWRFPVTVSDVVMMGRIGQIGLFRWPRRGDWARVESALEQVGMADFAKRQIGELSGGQQQRVFLARALAQEAELLMLDEPLTGLDMPSQQAILGILDELGERGITTLIATHDLSSAAAQFSTMMLINRRLIAYGPPQEVLTHEALTEAFGAHFHLVRDEEGEVILGDAGCAGGHTPVEPLLGQGKSGATPVLSDEEAAILSRKGDR